MKKFFKLGIAVVVAALFCGVAFAKLPPELFNKLTRANALKEGKIKDMAKVETMENSKMPGGQIETTSYTKGIKSRLETKMMSNGKPVTMVSVFDGTTGWQIFNNMKMKTGNAGNKAEAAKKYQEEANKNYDNMNVVRSETLNGKDCYVIEYAITEKGKKMSLLMWLDKESSLMYQMTANDSSGKEQMKTVMSDYRDVFENIKMPFKTEVYIGDKAAMKTLVKSIKVNQGLADSLFDVSGYKEMSLNPFAQTNIENQTGAANSTAIDSSTVKYEPAAPQNNEGAKSSGPLKNILKSKLPF
jgi:outer membrane lipoprotein-sorting protein